MLHTIGTTEKPKTITMLGASSRYQKAVSRNLRTRRRADVIGNGRAVACIVEVALTSDSCRTSIDGGWTLQSATIHHQLVYSPSRIGLINPSAVLSASAAL